MKIPGRAVFAAFLTITALLTLSACGDDSEAGADTSDPDIRGEVTGRADSGADNLGHILIEGVLEDDTEYDKASVRVDGDTAFYRTVDGETVEASWEDISEGQTVEAWFEGPVAESYPVQAYARQVAILE